MQTSRNPLACKRYSALNMVCIARSKSKIKLINPRS
jgi:hypothetical protein